MNLTNLRFIVVAVSILPPLNIKANPDSSHVTEFGNTAAGQMDISGSLRSWVDCRTGNWSRHERAESSQPRWDAGIAPLTP